VGALVVAALVAAAIFALSGGDATSLGGLVGEDPPEAPEFAWEVSKPKAVETSTKPNHPQAVAAAQAPAKAVTARLDDLYTAAFLEPANWMDGDYGDVLDLFADDSSAAAERQLDVLTAGPAAGDAFDTIRPLPSTLKLQVLFDRAGVAYAVEGSARFIARGSGADAQVKMISKGQYVFQKTDGDWLVVSFSVKRSDQEQEPKASASASASPSEAESS
jgi:hypothetical protein